MIRHYFQQLENLNNNHSIELSELISEIPFDDKGLIPVITQDAVTKEVLMLAWMNIESLHHTIENKRMTYWSRSRNELWEKGLTSGHTQALVSMSFDCDGDALLCQVNQEGAACHTGRPDCFYLNVDLENHKVNIIGDSAYPKKG